MVRTPPGERAVSGLGWGQLVGIVGRGYQITKARNCASLKVRATLVSLLQAGRAERRGAYRVSRALTMELYLSLVRLQEENSRGSAHPEGA